jgi:LysM domain
MSDAFAWEFVTAPARMPSRTARPRLRLVGPDERACAPALPATRLTRRGRLVIALVATAAVVTLTLGLATSVDAAARQIDHATTVSAGQTLSEVAAAQLPSLLINDAVARIQLVNGLNSSQVHAGQSLLIPAMP